MMIGDEKAFKLIEKSGVLNKNATLGQIMDLAKELDNELAGEYEVRGSTLLYRCFLLHDTRE